ncbi:ABC transporter permease [Streptomyces sp. NPDC001933]|uniref:ABC transporter permease n=1 Tax=Streptomyces sp. NPDC001933 TaxID=3364626 RepID=UPI0036A5D6DF
MSAITLRGPVRVVVRQHRRALWATAALLLLGIGTVVALRIWIANSDELCADGDTTTCGDDFYLPSYARTTAETFMSNGGTIMVLLGLLVGVFVAGPLIARELESGTFRLAWAQSASPAQWLAARLAVPAALAVSGTTVLALAYGWGRSYLLQSQNSSGLGWYETSVNPALGTTAAAFALLAVAVGALCALLLRRTVLAMGVTVVLLGTVAVGLGRVRQSLWPTLRAVGEQPDSGSWYLESGMLTASGEAIYWKDCFKSGRTVPEDPASCVRDQGGVTGFSDYHPASHFWPLQLVETGILLALAALAVAVAFRVLRRRHG